VDELPEKEPEESKEEQEEPETKEEESGKEDFTCERCGTTLVDRENYEEHLEIHKEPQQETSEDEGGSQLFEQKYTEEDVERWKKKREQGMSYGEIADEEEASKSTIYKRLEG